MTTAEAKVLLPPTATPTPTRPIKMVPIDGSASEHKRSGDVYYIAMVLWHQKNTTDTPAWILRKKLFTSHDEALKSVLKAMISFYAQRETRAIRNECETIDAKVKAMMSFAASKNHELIFEIASVTKPKDSDLLVQV